MTPSIQELADSTLAELCSLVTDGTHDTPRRVESGFPLIKAKEISTGRIDFDECDQISEQDHLKVIARSKPELGDTLFTHIGASLGAAAFVGTRREFSIKNIALFKPNPSIIDARYLYWLVVSPAFQALAKATKTGSAQPFLGLSQLRSHRVRYHRSLDVQRRIAGILSAYDDLIENCERRVRSLDRMVRVLYREWFVELRYPGHLGVSLVDSPLGKIPRSWRVSEVGSEFRTVLGGTPSRARSDYWTEGTIPWINSGKVNEIRIISESELITERALSESAAKLMPRRTTVLAITGATLGQVSYLEIETAANQSVVGIIDPNEGLSEWLFLTISSRIQEIIRAATGGAQQHINKDVVNRTLVAVPDSVVAAGFRDLTRPIFDLTGNLLFQARALRARRDLLLPRLFSGQLALVEAA